VPAESKARATWVFGAGPFQRGTIYQGTKFAGDKLNIPLVDPSGARDANNPTVSVAEQAYFMEPREEVARKPDNPLSKDAATQGKPDSGSGPAGSPSGVVQTNHSGPAAPATTLPASPAPATPPATPAMPPVAAPISEAPPVAVPSQVSPSPNMPSVRILAPTTPPPGGAPPASGPTPLSATANLPDPGPETASPWPGDRASGRVVPLPPTHPLMERLDPYPIVDPLPYYRR